MFALELAINNWLAIDGRPLRNDDHAAAKTVRNLNTATNIEVGCAMFFLVPLAPDHLNCLRSVESCNKVMLITCRDPVITMD